MKKIFSSLLSRSSKTEELPLDRKVELIRAELEKENNTSVQEYSERWGVRTEIVNFVLRSLTQSKVDEDKEIIGKQIIYVDNIYENEFKKNLELHLNVLDEELKADLSAQQVQDLICPSLYPYIRGESYTHTKIEHADLETDLWGRVVEISRYQWLPSIYSIDNDNKVKIKSYINNLNPEKYGDIYGDCEKVFQTLLPQIEKCLHYAPKSIKDKDIATQKYVPRTGPREYQVITKASNYVLKPGETIEGKWHVEGMSHEHILVSAIYYYSTSPLLYDSGLAFRTENKFGHKDLGIISTLENRAIIFSNELQHKVNFVANNSSEKEAVRKILCFFVIDPLKPVVTTADVPYQQWDHRKKRVTIVLLWVTKNIGVTCPKDIVLRIVELAKIGFSRDEALLHETLLTEERQEIIDKTNRPVRRNFSRCTGIVTRHR